MSLTSSLPRQESATSTRLYRAVWRWHFYAGLIVMPFLLVLAATGLIMVYGNSIETFLGKKYHVDPGGTRASLVQQALAAQNAIPGGKVKLFVSPPAGDRASVFIVTGNDQDHVVSIDPHGSQVLNTMVKDDTWFYWANNIHGTLLAGDVGDRLMEIAAGLGIVLVLTGLYLWWPRNARGFAQVLVPNVAASSRALWKELHVTVGFYVAIFLLFFFISGLAWTGIWGTKIVQAWSTFPAEKFDNVPLSDKTHASMNHGALKEVPWPLEQTPLPQSGSMAGVTGMPSGTAINLDTVAAFAKSIGFNEQFRINLPQDEKGVYTVSADSMDGDTTNPMGDRTVHLDQYTGKILADIRFADYSLAGKAMAAGVALHQANLGWWNALLNTFFCLLVIFLTLSGAVMWWKRRPAGTLGAPLYPKDYRIPRAILGIAAIVSALFPLTGLGIVAFAVIDFLLPKRLNEAGFQNA
jgi:uncharacterized iron-regulated membrane protein